MMMRSTSSPENSGAAALTWRIFAERSLLPEDLRRRNAEAELAARGLLPRTSSADGEGAVDIGALFGFGAGTGEAAAAFAVLDSAEECRKEFGFSAEYFFELSVNGHVVFSCLEEGSGADDSPLAHTAQIPLHKGRNVIAFYIRGGTRGLYFHFLELPRRGIARRWKTDLSNYLFPPELSLRSLPLITGMSAESAVISVEMNSPALIRLNLRRRGEADLCTVLQNSSSGLFCNDAFQQFRLSGLTPATEYEYVLEACGDGRTYAFRSAPFSFRTDDPEETEHLLLLTADTQIPAKRLDGIFRRAAALLGGETPDRFIHLGDFRSIYNRFDDFTDEYLAAQQRYLDPGIPCVFLRGNHEYRGKESMTFAERFAPFAGFFMLGKVLYFHLDSGWDLDGTGRDSPARADLDGYIAAQKRRLRSIVASPEWRQAEYHVAFSHGLPGRNVSASMTRYANELAGEFFLGSRPAYRLDLWICGDLHWASRLDVAAQHYLCAWRLPMRGAERTSDDLVAPTAPTPFPVVILNGPRAEAEGFRSECSVVKLHAGERGLHLQHYLANGMLLDDFTVVSGGKVDLHRSMFRLPESL